MKPSRYESEHTLTRCKCWIAFTWLTALLGALPIVAKMEANYYHEFEFCVLNWSSAKAYSMTLATLVLLPSLCTIIFTTIAIFLALRKPEEVIPLFNVWILVYKCPQISAGRHTKDSYWDGSKLYRDTFCDCLFLFGMASNHNSAFHSRILSKSSWQCDHEVSIHLFIHLMCTYLF